MKETDTENAGNLRRPADVLGNQAAVTWEAYNAMQTTKQRHIELLQRLDSSMKKYNLDPTPDDRKLLKHLLADHDAQVKRFTQASQQLKSAHPDAFIALFEYIALLNQSVNGQSVTH